MIKTPHIKLVTDEWYRMDMPCTNTDDEYWNVSGRFQKALIHKNRCSAIVNIHGMPFKVRKGCNLYKLSEAEIEEVIQDYIIANI